MKPWKHKVYLGDMFHDDDLSLSEKAQTIATRLARFAGDDDDAMLDELLEELCDAGHEGDVQWFDNVWSGIYDWADEERVWIDTFGRQPTPARAELTGTQAGEVRGR